MPTPSNYTYAAAGFNGFLTRSLDSNVNAQTLGGGPSFSPGPPLNFDQTQTSGSFGDVVTIGQRLRLDGTNGRISVEDSNGNEVVRLGDLGD